MISRGTAPHVWELSRSAPVLLFAYRREFQSWIPKGNLLLGLLFLPLATLTFLWGLIIPFGHLVYDLGTWPAMLSMQCHWGRQSRRHKLAIALMASTVWLHISIKPCSLLALTGSQNHAVTKNSHESSGVQDKIRDLESGLPGTLWEDPMASSVRVCPNPTESFWGHVQDKNSKCLSYSWHPGAEFTQHRSFTLPVKAGEEFWTVAVCLPYCDPLEGPTLQCGSMKHWNGYQAQLSPESPLYPVGYDTLSSWWPWRITYSLHGVIQAYFQFSKSLFKGPNVYSPASFTIVP